MADVRALLKAKRQEARISHPFATYNPSGQLKCSVCGSVVKHASAWEGHLGSKLHRTNVIRLKEAQIRQEVEDARERERETSVKRKAEDSDDSEEPTEKKRKVSEEAGSSTQGFPADFFSEPNRLPPSGESDDDEDDDNPNAAPVQPPSNAALDLEYESFQRELAKNTNTDAKQAYDEATIFAEPVPASEQVAGFPTAYVEDSEAAVDTGEAKRQTREREDRELIMDRLMEEERAQEDADTRVQLMKTKLESLRRKREAKKASKTTPAN
ncbi:hypothetical protein B0H34DRAFT_729203 [Crassisporium funariophilum]|nr:hypothetical protein B0H34DRAFT_729203 [Crassisporium funariophilum]